MSHNHHDHAHHQPPETFNTAFAVAVVLNLGFTLIEAIYAIMANSMSLLADAAHNLGDVLGLALAWGASWLLTKPATQRYSYGYKRTSILAAMTNALLLVATSAIIAYESISKLIHPSAVHELTVIIVAAIGIAVNGGTALLFIRGRKDDLNIKGAFLHLAADALISIGVVITGVIILFTGWQRLDPMVGLGIVVAILLGTWGLLRQSFHLLMDAVPQQVDRDSVENYFRQFPGVIALHDLHIWGLSTKEVALTIHLVIDKGHLTQEEYQTIHQMLQEKFKIHHVTIQVEQEDKASCLYENRCH